VPQPLSQRLLNLLMVMLLGRETVDRCGPDGSNTL